MAHQASDQGRSQSRVSRSEVASSSGFCLSFGSTLPSCVPVMTRLEKRLTVWLRVKYAQNEEKSAVFMNVTTVFACLLPLDGPFGAFSGPKRPVERPDSESNAPKWQDRGILSDNRPEAGLRTVHLLSLGKAIT
jgi:hypothetical protein